MQIKLIEFMTNRGGSRPGAGRKPSGPKTVPVNWRVSEMAKSWIKKRAVKQGESIASVIDDLIQAKITEEINIQKEKLDVHHAEIQKLQKCYELGLPARINGKIVRVVNVSQSFDSINGTIDLRIDTIPMKVYDDLEIIEINMNILSSKFLI